jgi:hypothetical protein
MRVQILIGAMVCAGCVSGCSGAFPEGTDAGGGGGDGSNPDPTGPTVLPFAVDDWYAPSGYMGDGESPGGIAVDETCPPSRPSSWVGLCHRYTWTPGDAMWGGVYWQYPDGNWGDRPGLAIPAGATKISFQAWGATGGERVDFMVGMMAVDGFQVTRTSVQLGSAPARYELELSGASYARVVGGFGWVASESADPVTFHIDEIRWE